jgi:hypothetical protein
MKIGIQDRSIFPQTMYPTTNIAPKNARKSPKAVTVCEPCTSPWSSSVIAAQRTPSTAPITSNVVGLL